MFDAEDILDTAVRLIARDGASAATASAIAREIGAPSGSIYHRFPSRDLLVARLWVRTVARFQEGFESALAISDVEEAADAAATYTPRWCREHIDEACVLVLHRRRDLTTAWPDELGPELDELGERLGSAMRGSHAGASPRRTPWCWTTCASRSSTCRTRLCGGTSATGRRPRRAWTG